MNLIPGKVDNSNGAATFAGFGIDYTLPEAYADVSSGDYTLGVRPEHMVVGSQSPAFSCDVQLVEPLGKDTLLYFEHGAERPTIAIVEASDRFKAGERLNVTFDPARVYLFEPDGTRVR